jgi:hypothetical protein
MSMHRRPIGASLPCCRAQWTAILTSRLDKDTRLVGVTISCEPVGLHSAPAAGANLTGPAQASVRSSPHVQPGVLATDRRGIALLRSDPEVFKCHPSSAASRYYSEVGASLAILRSGGNIASLMTR